MSDFDQKLDEFRQKLEQLRTKERDFMMAKGQFDDEFTKWIASWGGNPSGTVHLVDLLANVRKLPG